MINIGNKERLKELKQALGSLSRVPLTRLPTPLEPCAGLRLELGGPELWIKRDDLSGLTLGGNKTRMIEYALGEAIAQGVDTVVAGAGVQSNYCWQLAAACARLRLECHLLLGALPTEKETEIRGALLLDLLYGARVEIIPSVDWEVIGETIRRRARELEAAGRKVYIGRVGQESALGINACGYAAAALELLEQAAEKGLQIDQVWVCSSDTTQAGLALAFKHLETPVRLVGVPALPEPVVPGWSFPECISHFANQCAKILGLKTRVLPEDIISIPDYVGEGYGMITDASREAIRLVARSEGLLLDPVYSSKAMAGLIDHIRSGRIAAHERVVYIHTGGVPALFTAGDSLGLEDRLIASQAKGVTV
ncbi:MAG: D-cysteine desulfhydrase family protein [Acidobacteria bacterium]|jgi:D-cysteine desulfhydrase family pyridoxal phosphate-dependent enzyme|nr:D-cysteine desulfhydrase family protein [Acidobacteriota bacterium]